MDALLTYSWPGNVRELENVIERAVVICDDDYIHPKHLILDTGDMKNEDVFSGKNLKEAITLFKKHYIINVLEKHGWKQTESAKALDIQRTYLSRLIKELEINK